LNAASISNVGKEGSYEVQKRRCMISSRYIRASVMLLKTVGIECIPAVP
jgi:hypothetical protein